jgi:NAD(P)H dehydrogenase (quinone)
MQLETDALTEAAAGLRPALPETALGTWQFGGPTSHVGDVAGVEPEDFLTIARRYTSGPESRRTVGHFLRALGGSPRIALTPMRDLDGFESAQQDPRPAHLRLSGESEIRRTEHAPAIDTASL